MSTSTAPTESTVQVKKSVRSTSFSASAQQQPGALRNQARLEIQTRQAQFLLGGRTGPRGIIGLLQFGRRLGDIYQAVQRDDPYADWTLLRIEESIDAAKAFIHEKNTATAKALNALGSMKIELAHTEEPALVDLAFRRRFAFIELEPTLGEPWRQWVVHKRQMDPATAATIEQRLEQLNSTIAADSRLGKAFRIGHSYVTPSHSLEDRASRDWFAEVVATELRPLLQEYWFDAPEVAEREADRLLEGW